MSFLLKATDPKSSARAGELSTDHGQILTPIFMPVGTQATVKGIHQKELHNPVNAQIILGNTYHLYLRPGTPLLEEAKGLHQFMGWEKPILTDSGGYQVYSLGDRRKITEEGVTFSSHIDGSKHMFTPERAIEIQHAIGADIIMAFDECTPYPCEILYAKSSMEMTHRWLDRCIAYHAENENLYGHRQELAPIVQGSVYPELRKVSAEYIASRNLNINAIGGLSVGEPKEDLYAMTDLVCGLLPKDKPRYLMGVGTPANILECIGLGIDMFDCVLPTRNGRHGLIYTSEGIVNIKNEKWSRDFSLIDPASSMNETYHYSKAYVRHLFQVKELLGPQIASLFNLTFYMWLVGEARTQILNGTFASWKEQQLKKLDRRL